MESENPGLLSRHNEHCREASETRAEQNSVVEITARFPLLYVHKKIIAF